MIRRNPGQLKVAPPSGTCSHRRMPWDIWLIFFLLGVIVPWRGRYRLRELLAKPFVGERERISLYASTIAFQWLAAGVAAWRAWAHGFSATRLGLSTQSPWASITRGDRGWRHSCRFAVAQSAPYGPHARKDARKVTSSLGENPTPVNEGARSLLRIGRDGRHLRGVPVSRLRDGGADSLGVASVDHGRDIVLTVRSRSSLSRTKRTSGNHALRADFRGRSRRFQQPDSGYGVARCCRCCCRNCWATLSYS